MKEKELRLALVCYGGVSLAVYMFGATREIQKLLRASKLLHGIRDNAVRAGSRYADVNDDPARETDTEQVYFELLQRIGRTTELRVLVDIIAGASAGGINGIMLARAITQDLPLDPLRSLWLEGADVERLLDPDAASGRWSKFYMRPLVWAFGLWQQSQLTELMGPKVSLEVRAKLSRFVRSRWFQPPFSGQGFATMLYDGMMALDARARASGSSLLPAGYPFDLFLTVTDFFGYTQLIKLHSPEEIREREHRLVLSFGDAGTDPSGRRSLGSVPDLVFAARATASYPGAFPPATLGEMDRVVASRGHAWAGRDAFVQRALGSLIAAGSDPEAAAFLDGSILNNKPFGEAIAALRARPAHREVDRRIVYLEPNPARSRTLGRGRIPGFFAAIRASLSDIPRNQPIRDDLAWVEAQTDRIERLRDVVDGMADDIAAAAEAAIGQRLSPAAVNPETLPQWRDITQGAAAHASGFAFAAYAELRVHRVLDELALTLTALARGQRRARASRTIRALVQEWAKTEGVLPIARVTPSSPIGDHLPWVRLLARFDVGFRTRRLRTVIRDLNQLYGLAQAGLAHQPLDQTKTRLYRAVALFTERSDPERFPVTLRARAITDAAAYAAVLDELAATLELEALDDQVDALILESLQPPLPELAATTLLTSYVSFPFTDIVMLPMLQDLGVEALDPIKVDRISPEDANAIRRGGARACLKGIAFGTFGAFFSRSYRENDYLWGRLHAADRLVDIIISALEPAERLSPAEADQFKRRLFEQILVAERPHLLQIPEVFARIAAELAVSGAR
jgi:patatin-related protein